MANTLTGLVAPLYEALNSVSNENVGFISGVTRDNGNFAKAALGQVVTSFTVPPIQGQNIIPGVTPPNDGDQVLGQVNLMMTKARRYPIKWNGEEQLALDNAGPTFPPIFRQQMQQAFRAARNEIESDLAACAYMNASRATGTPGTAPFGTASDLSGSALTAQILDDNGSPMVPRKLVINSPTMANLRAKQNVLFRVNEAGTDELLRRGTIGQLEGFDIGYSPGIRTVTPGNGSGYSLGGAAGTVYPGPVPGVAGVTMLPITGGTGSFNPGDVITIAGDANRYVVAPTPVGAIASAGVIYIQKPGLRMAHATGDAISLQPQYMPNVGFSPDALLLATRMPALPKRIDGTEGDNGVHQTIVDDFTGIAFDVAMYETYRQVYFEVGIVWGVAAPNPEHIALLQG